MEKTPPPHTPYTIRKIWFLHPHAVIKDLYADIIRCGFDAYLIADRGLARFLVKRNPDSILYVNIDVELDDRRWLDYVRRLRVETATRRVDLGIMTDARLNKRHLARKYLLDFGVSCGFISLPADSGRILEVIVKILEANEARGRRRFVRAHCRPGDTFTAPLASAACDGNLIDVSLAGMLCRPLLRGAGLERGQLLNELRLTLAGEPIEASGAVHGARLAPDGRRDFLIMFDERRLNEKGKSVLIEYICRRQADFVDSESRAYAEEAPTADETEPAAESREDRPDDKLNQELLEELEAVQCELDEINGLLGKKGAIKS